LCSVLDTYHQRKKKFEALLACQNRRLTIISNWRLVVFLAAVGILIFSLVTTNYLALIPSLLLLALFVYLVLAQDKIRTKISYTRALVEVNEHLILRLRGKWRSFSDTGEEFIDKGHNYAYDLDIFGTGSLFQWLNTAHTYLGRQKLKQFLTEKAESVELISVRQAAVSELSDRLAWRQRFIAEGQLTPGAMHKPDLLLHWAQKCGDRLLTPATVFLYRLLPILTVVSVTLYALKALPYYLPALCILIQVILLQLNGKKRAQAFDEAETYRDDLKIYEKMLMHPEKNHFQGKYLAGYRSKLRNLDGVAASQEIGKLSGIVNTITNRHNMLYFIFNWLLMLDYQTLIALEAWKARSGHHIQKWLAAIGELECLSSLAGIKYDHPDWVLPALRQGSPSLQARQLGHPLLDKDRVCNDLTVANSDVVLLITGSNMSGKSTLLRTAGINLVLAYAGAPVCAQSFECTVMDIYTCMRVDDNLEMSISSFYAELLRIKKIVEAAQSGGQVFFLLDEIFKGTNSHDRHTGAMILVRQLAKAHTLGLVSTHDLELSALEDEVGSKVKNYHFDEYYQGNEIHFDYQLKPGVSTTRNAIYLMKMAGIEIADRDYQ
jgi:DNA mismatch repair ATPase MutS